MNRVLVEIKKRRLLSPSIQFLTPPPPPSSGFNLNNKVSPSVLLIIIILAIIFFISGLLHLILRFLLRPSNRDPDEFDNVTALQGQLQQLFHLHDAGVDQSFIDTLPVFNYKAIIGVKDPFDCAVCLCEFEVEDNLRLLPKCSHAFHMDCIDTWLLSHSTCPICRARLLPDFPPNTNCSPLVLVLESGGESESSRDILARTSSSHLSCGGDNDDPFTKSGESLDEKVVKVKLGKFKNVDGGDEGCSSIDDVNSDARRCFSMGSFAYVLDEDSSLQVPIRTKKKPPSKNHPRLAVSECGGCDSRREFNGLEAFKVLETQSGSGIGSVKKESLSMSKTWLRGKKYAPTLDSSRREFNGLEAFKFLETQSGSGSVKKESLSMSKTWLRGKKNAPTLDSSRRAVSFRYPVVEGEDDGGGRSEIDMDCGRCNSLDSQENAPSFGRRTLLWLMGKPNKVIHSSYSSNV